MASEAASQTLNNSAPGCFVASLSLPDMDVGSSVCNSLALQQYQFEQLIASQLTLTQQQAESLAERTKEAAERSAASAAEISSLLKDEDSTVPDVNYVEQQADALAMSIKAAAERAAAHAADISRLLNDEKCDHFDVPKVKIVELKSKREEPELKPHSQISSSHTSSKSKSISPIKPRNGGREEYYQRDLRSWSGRNSSSFYRYDNQRNHTNSSHRRRDGDRAVDRDSHDRYTSSTSGRSPLASKRSTRHRHGDSRSPQRICSRSRSPRPRHGKPSRALCRNSKSPLKSTSRRSPLARKRSPRHRHGDSRSPQRSRSRSRSPRPQHRNSSRVQNMLRKSKSPLDSTSRGSPLARKRSPRHRHGDSRSPQRSRSGSRSPRPQHRNSSRVQNMLRKSKSPLNSTRISSHRNSMKTTQGDDFRTSLSPTLRAKSVLPKESKVDNDANTEADDNTLNLDVNCREVEDKPSGKSLKNSHSTSDNSGKLGTHDMSGHLRVPGDSRTYPSPEYMNERKEDNHSLVMVGDEDIEEGELILSPTR